MSILINTSRNIELDFSEVEFMSTDFCAIIFGELSKKENIHLFSRITIKNINQDDKDLIKLVVALSKKNIIIKIKDSILYINILSFLHIYT